MPIRIIFYTTLPFICGIAFFRFIVFLQRYLYLKPGEKLYYSDHFFTLSMLVVLLSAPLLLYLGKFISPNTWRTLAEKWMDKGLQIEKFRSYLIYPIAMLSIGFFFFVPFFHNYLKLTDKHIAASEYSFWNNEKFYSYNQISSMRRADREGRYYLEFLFEDGKRVAHLFREADAERKILEKQNSEGIFVDISTFAAPQKLTNIKRFLFLLVAIVIIGLLFKTAEILPLLIPRRKR